MTDLTKHAEAILRAAFPSMNFAITTTAASQPSVLAAVQAVWNEAHDAGALAMREAAAGELEQSNESELASEIAAIDPASLRSE